MVSRPNSKDYCLQSRHLKTTYVTIRLLHTNGSSSKEFQNPYVLKQTQTFSIFSLCRPSSSLEIAGAWIVNFEYFNLSGRSVHHVNPFTTDSIKKQSANQFEQIPTHGAAPRPHSNTAAAMLALSLQFTATLCLNWSRTASLRPYPLHSVLVPSSLCPEQCVSNLNRGSTTKGVKSVLQKIQLFLATHCPSWRGVKEREKVGARNAIVKRR